MQNQANYKMTYRETLVSEEAMVDLCQIERTGAFPGVYCCTANSSVVTAYQTKQQLRRFDWQIRLPNGRVLLILLIEHSLLPGHLFDSKLSKGDLSRQTFMI